MWVVVLLLVAAVMLDLYANPPALPVRRRRHQRRSVELPVAEPLADADALAEAALVSSLLAGDLERADYRLAMERLAAHDAGSRPVVAPDRDR
jgi:hypothetical protein